PHAFYWFDLSRPPASNAVRLGARNAVAEGQALPIITTQGAWGSVVADQDRYQLVQQLPDFLGDQPWFRGRSDSILNVSIIDAIPLRPGEASTWLVPISVAYSDRDVESYLLALQSLPVDADGKTGHELRLPIARLHSAVDGEAVLVDAIEEGITEASLAWVTDKRSEPLPGSLGELVVLRTDEGETAAPSRVISHVEEQSGNIRKGEERVLVKVLRHIGDGTHPEWEIGSALTNNGFPHVPAVLGALEYRRAQQPPMTLAVLQALVPHEGNAWQFTLGVVDEFLSEAMSQGVVLPQDFRPTAMALLDATDHLPPQPLASLLAAYLPFARLLGQRTAELHSALASIQDRAAFAPEPQTTFSQRSLYQSMRGLTSGVLRALRHVMVNLDGEERELAVNILNSEGALYDRFRTVLMQPLTGAKIRTHGDLHLGRSFGSMMILCSLTLKANRIAIWRSVA
ncbi:MAG TPA: hypothetical protein VGR29_05370, partial [Thermomicrobiales bacterium]|nr:hypothetical protein [Thermomicrobiales bacterium]